MTDELKPCPFCGRKPYYEVSDDFHIVCCSGGEACEVGFSGETKDEAIAKWNTRPIEDNLRAERDAALERVRYITAGLEAAYTAWLLNEYPQGADKMKTIVTDLITNTWKEPK
jgi:Lar family restriction alleviation protein